MEERVNAGDVCVTFLFDNMTVKNAISTASSIELHYWFDDSSHTMDAFVQHRCEAEILSITKILSITFGIELNIETEPLQSGGLKRWFKIVKKEENKKAGITIVLVTTLLTTIVCTPLATSLSKIVEIVLEKVFEDEEKTELDNEHAKLENEQLRLQNEKLRRELYGNAYKLENNIEILKRRSNFYKQLEEYSKVTRISATIQDNQKRSLSEERFVERRNFTEFIISSDGLEPLYIENAIIEIISPVLKKGKYQWRGIYNGEIYSFNMKSSEFKELVQKGIIEFKNGTSIKCVLLISRKVDTYGNEIPTKLDILRVDEYFANERPIETPEGRNHRQKLIAHRQQLNFGDDWGKEVFE